MVKLTRNDWSVGVFLLVALVAIAVFLVAKAQSQGWATGTKHFILHAEAGHGLKENAPVRMNGLDVGVIEKIDLADNAQIEVHFRVDPVFAKVIHTDGEASIVEPPVIGITYVELKPGTPMAPITDPSGSRKPFELKYVQQTSMIASLDETIHRVESIMKKTDEALSKANTTLAEVAKITTDIEEGNGFASRLLHDESLANELQKTILHIAGVTAQIDEAAGGINRGEGVLGHALKNDRLIVEAENLLAKARESLGNFDQITVTLTATVAQVANRIDSAGASIEGMKDVVENTKKLTNELVVLTHNVNEGKGSAGLLLKDDALYSEAKGLIKELRESIQDLREQAPINSFIGVVFSAF